jgi:hypothetical protein
VGALREPQHQDSSGLTKEKHCCMSQDLSCKTSTQIQPAGHSLAFPGCPAGVIPVC